MTAKLGNLARMFRLVLGFVLLGVPFISSIPLFDSSTATIIGVIGGMQAFAMYTPGHTPACMARVVGNAAFAGNTLFMPDGGSALADFPGGNAGEPCDSIMKVLSLPDDMRLFMCRDYGPNGRAIQ